jgi:hypothetical protein
MACILSEASTKSMGCGAKLWGLMDLTQNTNKACIQEALEDIQNGTYKTCHAAALALELTPLTVYRRFAEKTKSHTKASKWQQKLNDAKEDVLVQWCALLGLAGQLTPYKTIA